MESIRFQGGGQESFRNPQTSIRLMIYRVFPEIGSLGFLCTMGQIESANQKSEHYRNRFQETSCITKYLKEVVTKQICTTIKNRSFLLEIRLVVRYQRNLYLIHFLKNKPRFLFTLILSQIYKNTFDPLLAKKNTNKKEEAKKFYLLYPKLDSHFVKLIFSGREVNDQPL